MATSKLSENDYIRGFFQRYFHDLLPRLLNNTLKKKRSGFQLHLCPFLSVIIIKVLSPGPLSVHQFHLGAKAWREAKHLLLKLGRIQNVTLWQAMYLLFHRGTQESNCWLCSQTPERLLTLAPRTNLWSCAQTVEARCTQSRRNEKPATVALGDEASLP